MLGKGASKVRQWQGKKRWRGGAYARMDKVMNGWDHWDDMNDDMNDEIGREKHEKWQCLLISVLSTTRHDASHVPRRAANHPRWVPCHPPLTHVGSWMIHHQN